MIEGNEATANETSDRDIAIPSCVGHGETVIFLTTDEYVYGICYECALNIADLILAATKQSRNDV